MRKIPKHQGSVGGKERKGPLVRILKKTGVLPEKLKILLLSSPNTLSTSQALLH